MDLPAGWTTDATTANGVTLQYYRVGDPANPPLVLLHGFAENARCRARLANDLAGCRNASSDDLAGCRNASSDDLAGCRNASSDDLAGCRNASSDDLAGCRNASSDDLAGEHHVVLFDARAHGCSDAPPTGYGIDDRVADLIGLCDALDLEQPVLLGHSMGGSTAAWTAARHPDRVRALALEDPAGMRPAPDDLGPQKRVDLVRDQLRDIDDSSVSDLTADYDDLTLERARRQAVADTELRPQIVEIARAGYPHLADAYPDISCPTLVLRRDQNIGERATDRSMADALPDGRLVHVPDASHHVFRDQYDAAHRELRAFLHRIDDRNATEQ